MDFSFDIPDSTDWLDTPLARVAPLESALRCQVCKDFFDNPVITSCSHTFCSLCIRRCLSSEGKCPTCRSTDQEVRLRRNWAVQELVDTFKEARADILALARAHKPVDKSGDAQQSHGRDDAAGEPAAKRRRVDDTSDQVASFSVQSEPPATAPQSRAPDSSVPPALEAVESGSPGHVGSSDVHQASPSRASPSVNSSTEPSDDIVACPICNRKMKNEAVFGHLDSCPGPSRSPTENSTPTPTPTPVSLNRGRPPKYSQYVRSHVSHERYGDTNVNAGAHPSGPDNPYPVITTTANLQKDFRRSTTRCSKTMLSGRSFASLVFPIGAQDNSSSVATRSG